MTASKQAKNAGLSGLKEVSNISKASPQTLNNWAKNKPELFKVVLFGCAKLKSGNETA